MEELRKLIENKLFMTDHDVYYEMRALKPGDNFEYGGKSFDGKIAVDRVMDLIEAYVRYEKIKLLDSIPLDFEESVLDNTEIYVSEILAELKKVAPKGEDNNE